MTRRTRPNKERRALAAQGRAARRARLRDLIDRASRVTLTPLESDMLRGLAETEFIESDALRATVGGQQAAANRHAVQLEAAHEAIREAEQRAAQAEAALGRIRAVLKPYDWPHAQVRAADIRAALDQAQPITAPTPEPQP